MPAANPVIPTCQMTAQRTGEQHHTAKNLVIGGGIAGIVAALGLLDGDQSVVLVDSDTRERFGGLALWAIIEMMLINRRDGAWTPPAAVARKNDFILVAAGLVAYVIVAAAHQWLFGFSPFIT